jgi:hypothetical protein
MATFPNGSAGLDSVHPTQGGRWEDNYLHASLHKYSMIFKRLRIGNPPPIDSNLPFEVRRHSSPV